MTAPEVLELGRRVADALERWQTHPFNQLSHLVELSSPSGDRICLRLAEDRVQAWGAYSYEHLGAAWQHVPGVKTGGISFSARSTPARMAAEIRRRLLPVMAANHLILTEAEREAERDAAFFDGIAELFPQLRHREGPNRLREAENPVDPVRIRVQLDPHPAQDNNTLHIGGLTRAQLLELVHAAARVRAAAEEGGTRQ